MSVSRRGFLGWMAGMAAAPGLVSHRDHPTRWLSATSRPSNARSKIETGVRPWDEDHGGLRTGDVVIVAGTEILTSALVRGVALHLACHRLTKVLHVSAYENRFRNRVLSQLTGMSLDAIRRGSLSAGEQARLGIATQLLDASPLAMAQRSGLCANELGGLHQAHTLMVIEDLLHLVRNRQGGIADLECVEICAILAEAKELAMVRRAAVLVAWDPRALKSRRFDQPERPPKYLLRFLHEGMNSVDTVVSLSKGVGEDDVWVDVFGYSSGRRGGFLLNWHSETWWRESG